MTINESSDAKIEGPDNSNSPVGPVQEETATGSENIDDTFDGIRALVEKVYATINTALTEDSKIFTPLIPIAEMTVPESEEKTAEAEVMIQAGDDAGIEVGEQPIQVVDASETEFEPQPTTNIVENNKKTASLEETSKQNLSKKKKGSFLKKRSKGLFAAFGIKRKSKTEFENDETKDPQKSVTVSTQESSADKDAPTEIETEEPPPKMESAESPIKDEEVPIKMKETPSITEYQEDGMSKSTELELDEPKEHLSLQTSQEPSLSEELETIMKKIERSKEEETRDIDEKVEIARKKKSYADLFNFSSLYEKKDCGCQVMLDDFQKGQQELVKHFSHSEDKERGFEVMLDGFMNFLPCTRRKHEEPKSNAGHVALQNENVNRVSELVMEEEQVPHDTYSLAANDTSPEKLVLNKHAAAESSKGELTEEECPGASSKSEVQEYQGSGHEEPEKSDELENHQTCPRSTSDEREYFSETHDVTSFRKSTEQNLSKKMSGSFHKPSKGLFASFGIKRKSKADISKKEETEDLLKSITASTEECPAEIKHKEAPTEIETEDASVKMESEGAPAEMEENEEAPAEMEENEEAPAKMEESEQAPAETEESEQVPAEIEESEQAPAEMEESEEAPAEMEESKEAAAEIEEGEEIPIKCEEVSVNMTEATSATDHQEDGMSKSTEKELESTVDESKPHLLQEPSLSEELESIMKKIEENKEELESIMKKIGENKEEETRDIGEKVEMARKKKSHPDLINCASLYEEEDSGGCEVMLNDFAKRQHELVKYFSLSKDKERGFEVMLDDFVNFLPCTRCGDEEPKRTTGHVALQNDNSSQANELAIENEKAPKLTYNFVSKGAGPEELIINKHAAAAEASKGEDAEEECSGASPYSEVQESQSNVCEEPEKTMSVSFSGSTRSWHSKTHPVSTTDTTGNPDNHQTCPRNTSAERESIGEAPDQISSQSPMIPFNISSISPSGSSFDTSCTSQHSVKRTNSIISRVSKVASRFSRKSRHSNKSSNTPRAQVDEQREGIPKAASRLSRKSRHSDRSSQKLQKQDDEEEKDISKTASRLSRKSHHSDKSSEKVQKQNKEEESEDIPEEASRLSHKSRHSVKSSNMLQTQEKEEEREDILEVGSRQSRKSRHSDKNCKSQERVEEMEDAPVSKTLVPKAGLPPLAPKHDKKKNSEKSIQEEENVDNMSNHSSIGRVPSKVEVLKVSPE